MYYSIDFETRSRVDLWRCGAHVYATDPSTGIYCMAYARGDDAPVVWVPGDPFPADLAEHIQGGGQLRAWNAQFERLLWWYVLSPDHGAPEPGLTQWYCTAARARAHGLPGALGECARALGLPQAKQTEGKRLIKEYSANNVPWDEIPPADQALWLDYCAQDVVVERAIGGALRELDDVEREEYWACERVNDRGVPVDVPLARAALEYAQEVVGDVDGKVRALTGGYVRSARSRKERDAWLLPQLDDEQLAAITEYKDGVKKIRLDQYHRDALRAVDSTRNTSVEAWLDLMDEAGGSTISKYAAMVNRQLDGRVAGALLWNGAGQTGRFSSRGLQMHNLRRDSFDDPDPVIADLLGGYELPDVTTTLARLVRSTVYHPLDGLAWCDWSAIEGRVCPWLADDRDGERKLDLFRDGQDVYVHTAASTFDVPVDAVTKDQRQLGKVQELSLQFLGGVGALQAMARGYGMHIEEPRAEFLRDRWRAANPWAQRFGRQLEAAMYRAVLHPGEWHQAGRVAYAYDGGDWLWCRLPSERLLAYGLPRIEAVKTPWGEEREAVTVLWGSRKPPAGEPWTRRAMHAGIQLENCIAAGTEVLTDRGWVNIESVHSSDRVHDGEAFVAHAGVVAKGEQPCMCLDGVWLTPDHEVLTDDGWRAASEVQRPHRPDLRQVDGCSVLAQPSEARGVLARGDRRNDDTLPSGGGMERRSRSDYATRFPKQVYDILNCGQRQRFVVRGAGGPLVVHNCTQAVAADLLREALLDCEDAGLRVVLHVHDEIIVEDAARAGQLREIMLRQPTWAEGLPLAAEAGCGERYGK